MHFLHFEKGLSWVQSHPCKYIVMSTMDELAAALNGHEITDKNGEIVEGETTIESQLPEEKTPEEETAEVDTTTDVPAEASQATAEQPESDVAVDDSGKRYVPQDRFDKVYGKAKSAERRIAELEAMLQPTATTTPRTPSRATGMPDKSDMLEVEFLKSTLPQFDPNSSEYSEELDSLGATIYKSAMVVDKHGKQVPTISRIEAARQAVAKARALTAKVSAVRDEARAVKSQQSDNGITNRVVSRASSQPNIDAMSDIELEAYLKQTGQWDSR